MEKPKDIFYVAFHYPPILGSSGVHRTLAFTRHLAARGWKVRVLTASLKAYRHWSAEQFDFIPKQVEVLRGFARDTSKHFAIKNRYLGSMALPDNWQSWIIGGTLSGLWSILKRRPDVIYSTYPIASAHFIAYFLHRLTGVDWIAELRDPMAQVDYPKNKTVKKWFYWIERKIIKHCKFAVVTAPGAKQLYMERYPQLPDDFWRVLPNGYDEEMMGKVLENIPADEQVEQTPQPLVVLHSGAIYPKERDPTQFFLALKELRDEQRLDETIIKFRLRACGHEYLFSQQLREMGITNLVEFAPSIPYLDALAEMYNVDGLLLLQADNCNYQIPAKAYEYLRVQKPVLALTPKNGDTGMLLQEAGVAHLADLDNKDSIKLSVLSFLESIQSGSFKPLDDNEVKSYSRQHHAVELEAMLDYQD